MYFFKLQNMSGNIASKCDYAFSTSLLLQLEKYTFYNLGKNTLWSPECIFPPSLQCKGNCIDWGAVVQLWLKEFTDNTFFVKIDKQILKIALIDMGVSESLNFTIFLYKFEMYLFKWKTCIFFQITKCICLNFKMYLFKLPNVFVQIAKCICPNYKMYLFKLQNIFVQIAKCIC